MCGSTTAEILLPVLVMLIMVGLRAAVSKTDNALNLHVNPAPASVVAAQAAVARSQGYYVLGNVSFNANYGSPFDGPEVASQIQWRPAKQNEGTSGVQTIQFVGDQSPGSVVQRCMQSFQAKYPVLASQVQNRFANDKDLDAYVRSSTYASSSVDAAVYVAVSFLQTDAGSAWSYAIRGNASSRTGTSLDTNAGSVNRLQTTYDGATYQMLLLRGHLLMQDHVEQWIIEEETGVTLQRSYSFQPFGTPPYVQDGFADTVSSVLGLFFTIIYMWPVTRLVKGIVEEKQLRIKEGMRMMGLPDSALFCSWFATYALIFFLTAIGITIVTSRSVYEHSNKFYIFIFFFFFALSTFAFCWLLSVFFSRSQVATTFAALMFLAFFFPYFAVQSESSSATSKGLACLASQICFGLGAVVIQKLESTSNGVTRNTAGTTVGNWSYNSTIGMFVLDFFLYIILALYFQQVVPSEWGTQQKWYFCVQPSFWRTKKIETTSGSSGRGAMSHAAPAGGGSGEGDALAAIPHQKFDGEQEFEMTSGGVKASGAKTAHDKSYYMEPVSDAVKANLGVSIRNLRKVFPTDGDADDFVALQDMNLDLYSGQILALLGHNGSAAASSTTHAHTHHAHCIAAHPDANFTRAGTSDELVSAAESRTSDLTGLCLIWLYFASFYCVVRAGKTTTINIMTGMLAPTSGDASVYGASISEDMASVRKILGVCPQHNILFDLLTVKEHLELYAAIKDVPADQTEAQIEEMIAQVGLKEKVNDKSAALSGGMQRKLSVGIALLGDSKIVFLSVTPHSPTRNHRSAAQHASAMHLSSRLLLSAHSCVLSRCLPLCMCLLCSDEPTSGMDPYSRRATWDLLKKKKEGRVIILTTHFMDEADQLGDRIAIMAKGDIKCCGSSLFLKGKYGVGYTLTITKALNFDEAAVSDLLHSSVPDVSPLSNIAAEISYRLPFQSSAHFADVFDAFDARQLEQGIAGYGISVTTLEEVFLRVGHEEDATPEALEQQKRALKTLTKQHSHREDYETRGEPPVDIADSPLPPPELVVVGERREEKTNEGVVVVSAGAGGNINTINVVEASKPAKAKSLSRTHSSRFSKLQVAAAGSSMYGRHFKALFVKRWINAKRDRKVWTWTLVYPFLILLIGCGLLTLTNKSSFPTLALTPANLNMDTANFAPVTPPANVTANVTAPNVFATSTYPITSFPVAPVAPGANATVMNQYLIDQLYPVPQQAYSRYNAFSSDIRNTSGVGVNNYVDNFVVYFNTTCQWCSSLGLNMYNSQLLNGLLPVGSAPVSIRVAMHPLPQTLNQKTLVSSLTAVIVAIGFAFMPANFIAFAVKEQQDKVKHQQLISGVSAASYWAANYVWDFCNYMVMGLLCLLIFKIWGIDTLTGSNTGGVLLAIVLYGLSVIPFNYLASFLFTESTSAQNSMLLFYIFVGALVLIAMIVLTIIESTRNIAFNLKFVCRLVPSYCFGECIANIITRSSVTAWGKPQDLFAMEIGQQTNTTRQPNPTNLQTRASTMSNLRSRSPSMLFVGFLLFAFAFQLVGRCCSCQLRYSCTVCWC